MAADIQTYEHGVPWDGRHGITQGYRVNNIVYISGQFSHDMQGAFIGAGDVEAQTRQTLENLDRVLAGFGLTKANLAYAEIFLVNPQDNFDACIRVFSAYTGEHRPAGSLIGVTYLASAEQLVEIRAVAHTG